MDIKPYPEYKDSGVPWLGKIPVHWNVRRVKYLLREIDARSPEGLEQLLSVSQYTGVTPRQGGKGEELVSRAESLKGYKQVAPDDLVINIMLAWNGSLGVSPYAGVVSPAYCVYRFNSRICPHYYHYLFRTPLFKGRIRAESTGVVESRLRLYSDDFFRMEALLPSTDEQRSISRFLDRADSIIQRLIAAKQRLIELLIEQKQAIIQRAVTRGLDSAVRTKLTGVKWVPEVPEHWEMVPNRTLVKVKKEIVGSASGDYTLLSLTKQGIIPRDLENPEGKFPTSFDTYQAVKHRDLIFCLFDIDETPRTVGLATTAGMITGAYTRFESRIPEATEFVYWFYLAMDNGKQLRPLYTGLRKVITTPAFLSAKMPLPPPAERQEIIEHIVHKNEQLDVAVNRARREIDLIREYRTRLVSDVVTGKLDVREVKLPEVDGAAAAVDLLEPLEAEDLIEAEEVPVADL